MTGLQSAYRKHHSIEISLLNIQNDLLNMAKGAIKAFSLLDFSAILKSLTIPYSWTGTFISLIWHLAGLNHTCQIGHSQSR